MADYREMDPAELAAQVALSNEIIAEVIAEERTDSLAGVAVQED